MEAATIHHLLFTIYGLFGGQGRNRTADAGLFRAALYQLSYLAIGWERARSIGSVEKNCQLSAKIPTLSY
jgi:hypothetical protein